MSIVVIEDSGYALTSDGSVWAWGDFDIWHHERASATPVRLPGMTGIAAIEAQGEQFVAMKADGTIWAWEETAWSKSACVSASYAAV